MSKKKHRHPAVPSRAVRSFPTQDLCAAFDDWVDSLFLLEEDADPELFLIPVGHSPYRCCTKYTGKEIAEEILTWGTCHGMYVPEETSRNLRELLGKERWPYHSDYLPGTYKQAAAAVLAALQEEVPTEEEPIKAHVFTRG